MPATEVSDDRSCHNRSAGGVALPQPGQHLHDVSRGLSEPTTGALALGRAFHGTLARNFRQKLSTGRDINTLELREVFAEEWALAVSDAALRDDEDAGELAATGQVLAATYVTEAAGSLQPHAVEQTAAR